MSRIYTSPNPTYYKEDGVTVNSNGKIYFYEPGNGSTTLKAIYSNKALTTQLTNPVILSATGKLVTPIFLNGDYNIKITDSADVQIDRFDNYDPPDLSAQFSDFDATITYAQNDFVRDTNGKYYQSLSAGNVGNDPSSTPTKWVEIYFIDVWNTNKTYAADDIVKYGDDIFVSLSGSNLGNTPSASSAFWRSFFVPAVVSSYTGANFEYRYNDGSIGAFDAYTEITESTYESIGPTGSGADYIWTAMDGLPTNATMAIVQIIASANRTSGADDYVVYNAYARKTGSTVDSAFNQVDRGSQYGGTTVNARVYTRVEFTVPLDASLRFDFKWDIASETSGSVFVYLLGFKS